MNNLMSYCGLVDAKIRASDKDLPVKAVTSIVEIAWAVHHYFMLVEVDILIRYVLNIYEIRQLRKFEFKYILIQ